MSSEFISVSVCIVTYNQENYIAECLESIVSQKTNFKFEIIVGEDCSTDNTRKIVQEYSDKYPNIIVPILYEKNVGPLENIRQVYMQAKGEYIAHIDGDDVALPGKLQKQFDVMEKGYAICSHNVRSVNNFGIIDEQFWRCKEGEYNWKYYIKNMPFFAHSSKMFVKEHLIDFINKMEKNTYDFELHLESFRFGADYHINEDLGVYRLDVGLMVNDSDILIKMIDTKMRVYNKSFIYFNDPKYIKKIYLIELLKMLKLCFLKKEFIKANKVLCELFCLFMRTK